MAEEILGTGLAFPIGVDARGDIALVRDEADVDQAIGIILGTAPGERPMRPEFGCGVHDYIFDTIDAAAIGQMEEEIRWALKRWEPRIDVLGLDFGLDDVDQGRILIQIDYRVRATNHIRNLVYPFYVIPAEEPE